MVGLANCRCGCDNHKVKVAKLETYTVGQKDDPPMFEITEEQAELFSKSDKLARAKRKMEKKKKQKRAGKILAEKSRK